MEKLAFHNKKLLKSSKIKVKQQEADRAEIISQKNNTHRIRKPKDNVSQINLNEKKKKKEISFTTTKFISNTVGILIQRCSVANSHWTLKATTTKCLFILLLWHFSYICAFNKKYASQWNKC